MSVVIETSIGDVTIDLLIQERPKCCFNFLKLCKIKYYNMCFFHRIEKDFIAQTGDPTGTGKGGHSIFYLINPDESNKYFAAEVSPKVKHTGLGTVSMVNNGDSMHGSQFFMTLREDLDYLDGVHTVFGYIVEGLDVLDKMNQLLFTDIIITHAVVLEDPFDDPPALQFTVASPEPNEDIISRLCIAHDIDEKEDIDPKEQESKAAATILEMVGDIPAEDVLPPDNVLFVCKLNPVTKEEDLKVIFSRFGNIEQCEIIKDQKTGESLQYGFIEFTNAEDCEKAYFKMDNVLIDDRRIHVDFSQSVSKYKWHRKTGSHSGKDVGDRRNEFRKSRKDDERGPREYRKRTDESDSESNDDQEQDRRRHRSKEDEKGHRRESYRDKYQETVHHSKEKEKYRDDRDRDRNRDARVKDHESSRNRYREHDRERDRYHQDRDRERSGKDRHRDRDRERGGNKDEDRYRNREHHGSYKEKGYEKDQYRSGHDKERDRGSWKSRGKNRDDDDHREKDYDRNQGENHKESLRRS